MTADADRFAELAEVRRRLAELEASEAEHRQGEHVQSALYRIAELASTARDMQEFYRAVHGVVGELMNANNFYIALYDEERQLINYPYWADELDDDWPEANEWVEFGSRQARGVTGLWAPYRRGAADSVRALPGADRAGRDRARRSPHGRLQLARRPAQGRGADGRPPRRAVVHEGRPL